MKWSLLSVEFCALTWQAPDLSVDTQHGTAPRVMRPFQFKRRIKQIKVKGKTELHCYPETIKNTSVSRTVSLGDTFLHYYEQSISHTSSCCNKHSLENKLCINRTLKIVPIKSAIFSCLSNPAVSGDHILDLYWTTDLGAECLTACHIEFVKKNFVFQACLLVNEESKN